MTKPKWIGTWPDGSKLVVSDALDMKADEGLAALTAAQWRLYGPPYFVGMADEMHPESMHEHMMASGAESVAGPGDDFHVAPGVRH